MRGSTAARVMVGTGVLIVGALGTLPAATAASAAGTVRLLPNVPNHPMYEERTTVSVAAGGGTAGGSTAMVAAAVATTPKLSTYSTTVTDGTSKFTYSMVGQNPSVAVANASTTVTTQVIPLVIKLSNGVTWDPTVADTCDAGGSALARTQASPVFISQPWTWGGTSIGSGQFTNAFQRAQFWSYAQPTGKNPTYGLSLSLANVAKVTISVPSTSSAYFSGVACGNTYLGDISINWLDSYLQKTVIPALTTQGLVNPSTLPIFLTHNVVEYSGTNPNSCCILGYHGAFTTSTGGVQTYSVASYDNSKMFTGVSDISVLTHEVGEWANDPTGANPTKSWGKIGQVTGCQTNFEVGDPLSGTLFTDTVGTFIYHPQELAFFSWFYHQSPSLGVNGWYSNQGKFTTSAAAC